MTIRLFDPVRDMERIVALYQLCFAEDPWNERFDAGELEDDFRRLLGFTNALFLVHEDEGKVIGAVIGYDVCHKPGVKERLPLARWSSFYVAELFVDPAVRKRGVGTGLITVMLGIAVTRHRYSVSVRTSIAQPAIQHMFIEKFGCKIVAQQDVVSTKWIGGRGVQAPDKRVIIAGDIPDQIKTSVTQTRQLLGVYGC